MNNEQIFMDNQTRFIVKVLILATIISVLIKYGGSLLSIAPTQSNILVAITLPSFIMAVVFWWRTTQNNKLH